MAFTTKGRLRISDYGLAPLGYPVNSLRFVEEMRSNAFHNGPPKTPAHDAGVFGIFPSRELFGEQFGSGFEGRDSFDRAPGRGQSSAETNPVGIVAQADESERPLGLRIDRLEERFLRRKKIRPRGNVCSRRGRARIRQSATSPCRRWDRRIGCRTWGAPPPRRIPTPRG